VVAQVSVVAAAVHLVHQASVVAAAPPQAVPPAEAQVAAHHPADAAAKQMHHGCDGFMVLFLCNLLITKKQNNEKIYNNSMSDRS
ncbi:MAG: hypothetical protein ACOCXO_03265, partial [Bacteroidota bacterium]